MKKRAKSYSICSLLAMMALDWLPNRGRKIAHSARRDFLLTPASQGLLNQWRDGLNGVVAQLVLHANSSIIDAMDTKFSDAQAFFNSSPFDDYKKSKENQNKNDIAVADRLNNIIKAIGVLIKSGR